MADAFAGAAATAAAARQQDFGISIVLPNIPVWVPDQARQILNDLVLSTTRLALQDAAGFISDEAGRFADTGNLAQSFGADPATATGGIEVLGADATQGIHGRVFSSLPYAIVMDQGRRPGAPISREGIDAIGLWAQRKLGLSAEQAKHAKFAIAANLVAQGFPGHGYFEDGVNKARPRIEAMFGTLGTTISETLFTKAGTRRTTGAVTKRAGRAGQ